jgi:hypothetical protein
MAASLPYPCVALRRPRGSAGGLGRDDGADHLQRLALGAFAQTSTLLEDRHAAEGQIDRPVAMVGDEREVL